MYCLHADRDASWLSPCSFLEVERERESAGFGHVAISEAEGELQVPMEMKAGNHFVHVHEPF